MPYKKVIININISTKFDKPYYLYSPNLSIVIFPSLYYNFY